MAQRKSILKIAAIDRDFISIRVSCDTAEKAAMNPGFDSSMAFITVTRGSMHVLRIIDHSGKITMAFEWGSSHMTLIGEGLEQLKAKVIAEIKKELIPYDCNLPQYAKPVGAYIMPYFMHYAIKIKYGVVNGVEQHQIWQTKTVDEAKAIAEKLLGKVAFVDAVTANDTHVLNAQLGGAK
jgi:hypothetical protein